jgi:hypothetical protein
MEEKPPKVLGFCLIFKWPEIQFFVTPKHLGSKR